MSKRVDGWRKEGTALPRLVREHQVVVLAFLGILTVALGVAGFLSQGLRVWDALYSTARLFTFNYDGVPGEPVPVELEIARFLAPGVTIATGAAALAVLLRNELDAVRARKSRNHILICGAGDRGVQFARAFHEEGRRLVVIEYDSASSGVGLIRSLGIPVVIGDATKARTLIRARADRAGRIICVTASDNDNAAIVASLADVPVRHPNQYVHSHAGQPLLDLQLTATTIDANRRGRVVEWFNIERLAATSLLSDYFATLHQAENREQVRARGFAVIGTSATAQSLVLEAAKQWKALGSQLSASDGRVLTRLPVTVIDPDAEAWIDEISRFLRGLDDVLALKPIAEHPLATSWNPIECFVTYVAIDDIGQALAAAMHLDELRVAAGSGDADDAGKSAIVVRVFVSEAGLADVLASSNHRGVYVVNTLRATCTSRLIEHTLNEQLARENHNLYRERIHGLPASAGWDEISEEDRNSNREAAKHHLTEKVRRLGLRFVPITSLEAVRPVGLSEEEIELIAQLEHDRWVREKMRNGWHYADIDEQDRNLRLHPDLKPWVELSESARDKDRMFVRRLPAMLHACGYLLVRPAERPAVSDSPKAQAECP